MAELEKRPVTLTIISEAIRSVRNPQFFTTELGYQGELLAEIRRRLPDVDLPGDAIVQQEYQKRLADHGINVRPDIIVHVPAQPGSDRTQGNFVVFELNRSAGPTEVQEDFANLDTAMQTLQYPLAVFLNVGSGRTQATHYHGPFKERLHCFAVRLTNGRVRVEHAYWRDNVLIEESEDVA
jgi:hypothetical protein